MKKGILSKILTVLAIFTIFSFCRDIDNNEDLIKERVLNEYPIVYLDYASLPQDSDPYRFKCFSESDLAKNFLPEWLKKKYFNVADNSSVIVSYNYKQHRDIDLKHFETSIYSLDFKDYKKIWGGIPYVNTLSPTKLPEVEIPQILKDQVDLHPQDNEMLYVEYTYSSSEPYMVYGSDVYYINEDFSTSNSTFTNIDWDIRSLNGTRNWNLRTFGLTYMSAMATANGIVDANFKNMDAWLITTEIDLTQAVEPKFSFDLSIGTFSNQVCMGIFVCNAVDYSIETPIDINKWTDISVLFELPSTGVLTGYGQLQKYGEVNLKDYAGQKVRIAFRYTGSLDPMLKTSTTYEVDNVRIHEITDRLVTTSIKNTSGLFQYTNGMWSKVADNDLYVLQSEDYEYLNVKVIDTNSAALLIPKVLSKVGLNTTNNVRVVYKNTTKTVYADVFANENGSWKQISLINTRIQQDKYSYNKLQNIWSFIETFN